MSKAVDRIKSLIKYLPEKDIPIGYKFIEKRDFESLKELVDSASYKIKRNLMMENPREEYKNINIRNLNKLKLRVDEYVAQLFLPEEDICEIEIEECFIKGEKWEDEIII